MLLASEQGLTVKVPVGASLGSITYTNAGSGLSTVSQQEFVPIVNIDFGPENLELKCTMDAGFEPLRSFIHDLDGDSKPEIVNLHQGGFSILKNVHTNGSLSASSFLKLDFEVSEETTALDIADMNGDGRKDIIVNTQSGFRIFLNNSTAGQIIFNDPVDVNLSGATRQIACGDFDSDGKIDVAIEFLGDSISVLKNKNTKGTFLATDFSVGYTYYGQSHSQALTCAYINSDGQPDLIMGLKDNARFLVLKNNSSEDFFSFTPLISENSILGTGPSNFSIHDLNQDGGKDVVTTPNGLEGNLSIFQTAYWYSDIYFYPPAGILPEGANKRFVTIADINGEGIPDVIAGTSSGKFSLFVNHTQPYNNFSPNYFELIKEYGTEGIESGRGLAANDLNGDGKTDVVNITGNGNSIEIWENTALDGPICAAPTGLSFDPIYPNTVKVSWSDSTQVGNYQVELLGPGSNSWIKYFSSTTSQQLYLSLGSQYAVRVKSVCGNFPSSYDSISFSTPCPAATSLAAYFVSTTEVYLSWYDPNYLGNYKLEYKSVGQDWITAPSIYYLNGLTPGTNYEMRIQVICPSSSSEFLYSSFTTECPLPPIVSVSSITPTSGKVELSPFYEGAKYLVEYSRDGINWSEVAQDFIIKSLSIGTAYFVRAKVLGCINTETVPVSFRTACPAPTSFQVNNITSTSASLSWQDDFNIGRYSIEYTENGIINWTPSETTSTNHIIEGLVPETTYKARVHSICPERISDREPIFFTTISISEGHNGTETLLFPNPSDGEITLLPSNNLLGKKAVIMDMRGRVMREGVLEEINIIDISSYSSGLFLLLIEGEKPMKFSRK